MKKTNLKRYGVEFFQYTEEHTKKCKETNLKKLGVEFPAQSQLIKNKIKETWEEKYGKAPSQCEEIREKVKKTNLEKYGVECTLQNKAVREKAINSIKEKYGVSNVSLSKEVQEKRKNTFIEKYGCENPGQIPEVKNKIANSFYLKGSEFKTSSQQLKIFNILKEEYGDDQVKLNYPVLNFNLDIALFINQNKIDIEYDGWYWHQDKQKDIVRDNLIKRQGYKILRIRSGEMEPTKEQLLNKINFLINSNYTFTTIVLEDWKNNY